MSANLTVAELKGLIRGVPDFPQPGIDFKDATPLFANPVALRSAADLLLADLRPVAGDVDLVVGAEARGFILGPVLATALGAGFIPVRRPGKLPAEAESVEYRLEYGVDALQVHSDALQNGRRVVVHDDLIATGGTAAAIAELVEKLGGEVIAYSFLIELTHLHGRERLRAPVHSLIELED
jgi:adenine phosphoribosyltransferase